MNSLPPPLGNGALIFWRLDRQRHAAAWETGEGARLLGGRWNPIGLRTVYAALDPGTAILEVAVHKGFAELDTSPHVLTCARVLDPTHVRVLEVSEIPNLHWLVPSKPSAGQQAFGAALLASAPFILIPSVVSRHSWNLIFDPALATGLYTDIVQEPFALDTRLHPAT